LRKDINTSKREQIKKGLRALKGFPKTKALYGFDIETANNNKDFVCASLVSDDYVFFTRSKDELIHELLVNKRYHNSFIVATNLMFDFFGVFSIREAHQDFKIIERQGKLIFCKTYVKKTGSDVFYHPSKVKGRKDLKPITFIDSISHFTISETLM
jgi:hypothetical protein